MRVMIATASTPLALLALLCSCGAYEETTKQVPTFANLQIAAAEIQEVVAGQGEISDSHARLIIAKRNDGMDSWGSPIVYASRPVPRFSFVLISTGRDRALDYEDIDVYFEMNPTTILGDFDRDIVFRDGEPVTAASPK